MRYETIADIYSANEKFRQRFLSVVDGVSPEEATALPDGEAWSIQQIVEHVSIVNNGMSRICGRLIAAAKQSGAVSDGSFSLTPKLQEHFAAMGTRKAEAPDRVHPTGDVTIADSLVKLAEASDAFGSMRSDMESVDLTGQTFPHPYFGEMSASEWLLVCGLHEGRHMQQIERILDKIRQ